MNFKSVPTISYKLKLQHNFTKNFHTTSKYLKKEDRYDTILIVTLLINGPRKNQKTTWRKKEEGTLMVILLLTFPRN